MDITPTLLDALSDALEATLQNAQNPDDKIRSVAEGELKKFQDENFPNFLLSLSEVLSSDKSVPKCRTLAGIIIKNSVEGKYSEDNNLHIKQWFSLDPLVTLKIKELLLITLGSSVAQARHASSQIIGKLAFIEIPCGEWQDLIDKLLGNIAQQGASPPLKQGTLEALEHVFEEFLGLDQDKIAAVLDAVIKSMNRAEQSSQVRLAAVKALQNVLKHADFAKEDCRSLIMSAIQNAAESDEAEMIKQEAFGCLVVVASRFYMILEPYMEIILGLTSEALKGGEKSGALQCMEFWITMCEKVIELREQQKLFGKAIPVADCLFIEKPLSLLVPVLLETLLNQERDDDAQKISIIFLGLVARTIGDTMLPLAMPFIERNIEMADWQSRKAATSALGVVLEGTGWKKFTSVLSLLMDRMEDPNKEVRFTAACTFGRLFEHLHSSAFSNRIFTNENFLRIMAVLSKSSKDVREVSEEACRAIYFLAQGYDSIPSEDISYELSDCLSGAIDALISISELDEETPFRLPAYSSAYEALIEVVKVSNIDLHTSLAIRGLMHHIMRRLNTALDAKAISSSEKSNKYHLQELLCSLLHVIIQELGNSLYTVSDSAQFLLLLFCRVLTCDSSDCDSSAAHDKAAIAIGALARAVGPKFVDLMLIFLQYFNVKLLSPVYVEAIGDIFHVLGDEVLPYCGYMMNVLYEGYSKRALKPHILACFGEIAHALGEEFDRYLKDVMKKLKDAAHRRHYENVFEEDKVDYSNQLRQGIIKAYSGILRGMKDPVSGCKVAAALFEFIQGVPKDEIRCSSLSFSVDDVLSKFVSKVESWRDGLAEEVTM